MRRGCVSASRVRGRGCVISSFEVSYVVGLVIESAGDAISTLINDGYDLELQLRKTLSCPGHGEPHSPWATAMCAETISAAPLRFF